MKQSKAPQHLSKAAQAWWSTIESDYVLTEHQKLLLSECATAWDRSQQARRCLEQDGLMLTASSGRPMTHPAVAVERDARLAFVRILRELALDAGPAEARPPYLAYGGK